MNKMFMTKEDEHKSLLSAKIYVNKEFLDDNGKWEKKGKEQV